MAALVMGRVGPCSGWSGRTVVLCQGGRSLRDTPDVDLVESLVRFRSAHGAVLPLRIRAVRWPCTHPLVVQSALVGRPACRRGFLT